MVVELPERTVIGTPIATTPRAEARAPSIDLLGVRVLVVDDDPDARDLCAMILGMHGARVSTAESAMDAMTRLESEDVEVMVSDIGMPNEDGCSLVSRAVARFPGLRCVALSAYTRREDGERALAAGFLKHLAKPVDPSHLIDTVREIARAS
jgi:CheY-like chemotaxis protein